MLTIHVWPRRLKEFLLTHPLYKSPGVKYTEIDTLAWAKLQFCPLGGVRRTDKSALSRRVRQKLKVTPTPPQAKSLYWP